MQSIFERIDIFLADPFRLFAVIVIVMLAVVAVEQRSQIKALKNQNRKLSRRVGQ